MSEVTGAHGDGEIMRSTQSWNEAWESGHTGWHEQDVNR